MITGTVVLLVAVVLLLIALYALLSARSALHAGAAELQAAQAQLSASRVEQNPYSTLVTARTRIARAQADFNQAQSRLAPLAPILTHLGWVPRAGAELAAAPTAARTANELATGATEVLGGLLPAVRAQHGGHLSLAVLLPRLAAARPRFAEACTQWKQADAGRRTLDRLHATALAGSLATLDRQLPTLQILCRSLVVLPDLLGARHPATYLVAYLDPEQLRATGGFLGSASVLTVRAGAVHQVFRGTWLRDDLRYRPPDPVVQYDSEPGWLFRDSNWSPNFPTSAALERFFLQLDLHENAPNVINLTPQATAAVLQATGDLYVPEYHRRVTAGNVFTLADYYTHRTSVHGPLHFGDQDVQKKQFIAIVANRLLARLHALSVHQLLQLARVLPGMIARRDLLLNFQNRDAQSLVIAAGADGRINPTTADYLGVVDTNLSYNKVNPYVHQWVTYTAHIQPDRWLQADLTVRFHNVRAPAIAYAQSDGPSEGRAGAPGDYADFLRIYVPAGAQIQTQSGWTPWSGGPAYGKTMLAGYVIVRIGKTRTVHLRYTVPPNIVQWSAGRRYRLLVQHQPGAHPDMLRVAVSADGHALVHATIAHPLTDQFWSAGLVARPYHPLLLPSGPPSVVQPGHWIEPHAFLTTGR